MKLPAMIEGMSFSDYLADPAPQPSLTSSIARELNSTAPAAVRHRTTRLNPAAVTYQSEKFDIGTAAHALFVGGGEPIVEIDFPNYRKQDAKDERDAAYAAGHTPILAHQMVHVREMVGAVKTWLADTPLFPFAITKATHREATIIWKHEGIHCRCRPDLFFWGKDGETVNVIHYKTTNITINRNSLARYAATLGWQVIHEHYRLGVKALTGIEPDQYFLVQETEPPYLPMIVGLDSAFVEYGEMDHEHAVKTWRTCLTTGKWPGHRPDVVTIEAPAYMDRQFREREPEEVFEEELIL